MKILLINPPWFEGSILDNLVSNNPPMGLAYIAAVLEKGGYKDTIVRDMKVSKIPIDKTGKLIDDFKPDIVGIRSATGQITSVIKMIRIIKSIDPNIICVLGGSHPSVLPEKTLKETNADIVVLGEGEITMLELVKAIDEKKPIDKVAGLYYKKNDK
ncbi:MAG: cobalamin-dependent protein, partial [SAR202 cluster bacterium]|nr:cobalamin-dependent protein [SAR202 cluster bacterium]